MSKARRPHRQKQNPDDVIAGRIKLDARELCAMIHDVNPSGRNLPAQEEARRYAQKSRLQSLLIRRFSGETEVRPEPQKEGVISLRHRPTGADACHAILAALDEDARSWAQRELDLGTHGAPSSRPLPERHDPARARPAPSQDPEPPSSASAERAPISELLRFGERAVEAYDYDVAQRRLSIALTRSGGAAEPAIALLSLLVERLGADRDALSLEDRLSESALAEPEVRRLLAVSAARLAEREKALKLVKGLPGERAGEVLAALARASIEAGDLEAAARDLAQCAAQDPLCSELAGLSSLLKQRRAEQSGPLEDEVRRLVAEGRFDDAEARAAELLRRWPESHVGRSAQRAVEEHRRKARAQELYAKAEEAAAAGEIAAALSLLQQALASAPSAAIAEAARRRVAELELAMRDRRERAELDNVCRLLEGPDLAEGLRAYLALSDPQRGAIRERVELPHLGWLEEASARGSGARSKAAVLAVIALSRAMDVARSNPGAALDLLASHSKALQGVGVAREVAEEARRRRDELDTEAARARVTAARRALDEGGEAGTAQAEELLADAPARGLTEGLRAEVEELKVRIKGAALRQTLMATFERYRRERSLILAQSTADELARTAPNDEERQRWATASAELRGVIQRLFHVKVHREPLPAGALRDFTAPRGEGALRLLIPGSRRMVLAQAYGERVFLRVLDLEGATLCASITLHAGEPFDLIRAEVREGRVILVSRRGAVLEVALESGELMSRYPLFRVDEPAARAELAAPRLDSPPEGKASSSSESAAKFEEASEDPVEEPFEGISIAPDARTFWILWQVSSNRRLLRIVENERGRALRQIRASCERVFVSPLCGAKEPRMAVFFEDDEEVALFDPRGVAALRGGRASARAIPNSLAACPDGEHLFLLARERRGAGGDPAESAVGWACLRLDDERAFGARDGALVDQGAATSMHRIEGLHGEVPVAVATSVDARMVFVLFGSRSGERELLGLKQPADPARAAELTEVFRVAVPRRTVLLEEPVEGRAVAVALHEDGLKAAELGPQPPALGARAGASIGEVPTELLTAVYHRCGQPTGATLDAVLPIVQDIHRGGPGRADRLVQELSRRREPDKVINVALALYHSGNYALAGELATWVNKQHPTHAGAALVCAGALVSLRHWGKVRELLEKINPAALDTGRAQHFYHLLGAARLHLGEPEEALWALERGREVSGGTCDLGCLVALATPLRDGEAEEAAWSGSADQAAVRQLVRAVALADARLAEGDAGGARLALDRRVVWEAREVQSLARLAEAHLAGEEAGSPVDRFRKGVVLAAFQAAHGDVRLFTRREAPLPRGRWDKARLDALAERAKAWLDASFGDPMVTLDERVAASLDGGEAPVT